MTGSAAPTRVTAPPGPSLLILRTGPLALLQDLGRPGSAAVGVGRAGAADRGSLRRANAAVGNPVPIGSVAGAAAVEIVLGGLLLRAVGDLVLAVAGAPLPVTVDGRAVDGGAVPDTAVDGGAFDVPDGATVRCGSPRTGLRSYLAVRGGFEVPVVLGSRSTDTLSGLGPAPLRAGDVLRVGAAPGALTPAVGAAGDLAPAPGADTHTHTHADPRIVTLAVHRGPRDDWFADPDELVRPTWTVSPSSDRVGIRFTGAALARAAGRLDRELPSEGLVRGALQVPPTGEPVLMGPDHPVTGGYPVIGVVPAEGADAAAQLRPGSRVRFVWARLD